jgi:hypothetical protein
MITVSQAINELYRAKLADNDTRGAGQRDFLDFLDQIQGGFRDHALDLSRCLFGIAVLARIPRLIRLVANITRLRFYGNLLRDTGVSKVYEMLQSAPDILYIDIGCNDLTDRSVGSIIDIVEQSNIISLRLGSLDFLFHPNRISRDGLSKILDAVSGVNRLQALGLPGLGGLQQHTINRSRTFPKALANCLRQCSSLRVLDMAYSGLVDSDQGVLGPGFALNSGLKRLTLEGNCFKNGLRMMEGVVQLSSLVFLNLASCRLDAAAVSVLNERLREGWGLISFDISCNPVGSDGISELFQVLADDIYMTSLNVSDTHCDASIAENLKSCISRNQIMQDLNLSLNNLGDSLSDAFEGTALVTLDLSTCRITDPGGIAICEALGASQQLLKFAMRDNFLSKGAGYEIVDIFQVNENLITVDLSSNQIDRFAMEALQTICSRNRTTSHRHMLTSMRREHTHLSIQKSKIPMIEQRLEQYRHQRQVLLDEIAELEVEIESVESQFAGSMKSTDKSVDELRKMISDEQKLITDMTQKTQELHTQHESTMVELNTKRDHERREFAKSEVDAAAQEKANADYQKENEAITSDLQQQIGMCEEMFEEAQRAMRNKKRLREYEVPAYPYAEEEARLAAEKDELARTALAADLARELAAFGDLGIPMDALDSDPDEDKVKSKKKGKKRTAPPPPKTKQNGT